MSNTVIHIENVSKLYRLGLVSTRSIAHDVNRWWYRVRGKEDPYLKIGQSNQRDSKSMAEYVWALKDVNLKVEKGEVIGIIGRNGAGKSTLLKILSRVTAPTSGVARIRGRVASLLEVGTGFHPELTGRENIMLYGAIMGMARTEVLRRLDEIIDFSGCSLYIDTPVKRYSSGMYVRLAFSVAAHLEPDVLIIDEVLAVGDAEFQNKCLGKMSGVAGEGRTLLFVSHNMAMVQRLCRRAVLIRDGAVVREAATPLVVQEYLYNSADSPGVREWGVDGRAPGDEVAELRRISIQNDAGEIIREVDIDQRFIVEVSYRRIRAGAKTTAILHLINEHGVVLFATNDFVSEQWGMDGFDAGLVTSKCIIPGNLLAEGTVSILFAVGSYNPNVVHAIEKNAVSISVTDRTNGGGARGEYAGGHWPGVVRPLLEWVVHPAI